MLRVFTVYRHLPNRDYRKRAIAERIAYSTELTNRYPADWLTLALVIIVLLVNTVNLS